MPIPAFEPGEIQTNEPTRSARLKWVVVLDASAPLGQRFNAVACIAASTGATVIGLIGSSGTDGSGSTHPGLPWAGCSVLAATTEQILEIRNKAVSNDMMFVADMPLSAQTNRVYDEYLAELRTTSTPQLVGISIVGSRNAVDRLVKRLSLVG
ncbi:MAG: DUF2000 family protein [Actinomycetota bacterium]|nr:DUF2000 family protein [Actinomycetota bacterium]